jgi:hypothetical protein
MIDGFRELQNCTPDPASEAGHCVLQYVLVRPHRRSVLHQTFTDLRTRAVVAAAVDEGSIVEQIATAEFFVGCGHVDQATAVLRQLLLDGPDNIQIREKLSNVARFARRVRRAICNSAWPLSQGFCEE